MRQVPDRIEDLSDAQLRALTNLDQPRNRRNANPGNIEDGPFAKAQPGYAGTDGRFALYDTPEQGAAANDALMANYGRQGFDTPAKIISKYAPPNENDTQAYINRVASALGVGPNEQIDLSDPRVRQVITSTIHQVEGGGPTYDDQVSDDDLMVIAFGATGTQNDPIDLKTAGPENADLLKAGTWVKGPDGTVYALPSDAMPGQTRAGDQPQSGGLVVRPQSTAEDVIQSGATGVVKGVTGLAGLPGDVGNILSAAPMMPGASFGNLPSSGDINKFLEGTGAQFHEPQTTAGEYSRTIGEFLPGAVVPGGIGTKAASVLVPALASETAGQLTEGKPYEGVARFAGGLVGGAPVALADVLRGGPANVLRRATQGVTPQQFEMAQALRESSPIPLTAAEAIQQVTGGATGLGRAQRVAEGSSSLLAPMMAQRPQAVRSAWDDLVSQIGPQVEPQAASGMGQQAAEGVIGTMRKRVNESAQPFYDRLPGQTLSPEDAAALQSNPSYARAQGQVQGDPVLASLLSGGPEDLSTVNRVVQQLDQMEGAARPGVFNPQGNNTLASQYADARRMASQAAESASPDYAAARQTVSTGREAFVDPLKRGPLGVIAGQPELRPTLSQQTGALFPSAPPEGGAAESLRALSLMNEIDPNAGPALTRQFLASQGNEALQSNLGGPNQFGGAKLAAALFGNPEQERTLMGAIDMAAPDSQARTLVEALRATGQREAQGSNTAFNTQLMADLRGGNMGQEALRTGTNPGSIVGRVRDLWDNALTEWNANKLAETLMADPEEATRLLMEAQNRRRGANRIRGTVAATQMEEDR